MILGVNNIKRSLIDILMLVVWAVGLTLSGSSQNQGSSLKVELPAPTGKHVVGRTSFHWVDASRAEEMTDDPNDRRELMVTVWYPAEQRTGDPAPYLDNLDKLSGAIKHLHFVFARSVRTHTETESKLSHAKRRYPVLIFSPGNGLNAAFYTAQIEDLASHGYVVFGIDHPYESRGILYPDGRIVGYSEDKNPKPGSPNFQEEAARFYRQRVDGRVADASFVLNQLEKLNPDKTATSFSGRLDLKRVGAFGHSIGGIAAAEFCQSDRRFKACLNLDGHAKSLAFYTDANGKGPQQPFMIFEDVAPELTEQQLAERNLTRQQVEQMRERERSRVIEALKTVKSGSYLVKLRGATHQSFSDEPLILPFGDAKAKAAHRQRTEIIRAYTLAFFDQTLKNQNANLLKNPSGNYPEVTVERFSPARQ